MSMMICQDWRMLMDKLTIRCLIYYCDFKDWHTYIPHSTTTEKKIWIQNYKVLHLYLNNIGVSYRYGVKIGN